MRQYVVYRHGGNEANQRRADGAPEKMPVLRLDADSPADACRRAAQSVPVAAGQYLSAEPAEAVDEHEAELNRKAESLETDTETA